MYSSLSLQKDILKSDKPNALPHTIKYPAKISLIYSLNFKAKPVCPFQTQSEPSLHIQVHRKLTHLHLPAHTHTHRHKPMQTHSYLIHLGQVSLCEYMTATLTGLKSFR